MEAHVTAVQAPHEDPRRADGVHRGSSDRGERCREALRGRDRRERGRGILGSPEDASTPLRMRYEPPLDGVRALAILAVVAYHCFPAALPGGFTGVDVFFVLSGYLITSVILTDVREGSFSLKEFYLRRVQRLLPNAVTMVLASVSLSYVLVGPTHAQQTSRHSLWTLFNVSNVYIRNHLGGYWGDSGEYSLLLHTWSLAVEEQFYLLFPAALLVLSRRWPSRVVSSLTLLAAVSLGAAVVLTRTDPDAAFYLLPSRAWQLLVGAILAAHRLPAARHESPRPFAPARARELAGWAGLAGIAAAALFISGTLPYPGVMALAPTFGTALVLVSVSGGGTTAARLLSVPFLTLVGRMSYSIYLWHWPGLVLGRLVSESEGLSRREAELVGVGAGLVLAAAAYRFVEQPLRRRGTGRRRRLAVLAIGFSACAFASAALSLRPAAAAGADLFDRPAFSGLLFDVSGIATHADLRTRPTFADMRVPPPVPGPTDRWRTGGVVHAWGEGSPRVVVVGSSHANMYGTVVDDACRRLGLPVAFLGADGTSPVFGDSFLRYRFRLPIVAREYEAARTKWLGEWRPDVVFVIDKWDNHGLQHFGRDLDAFVRELERFSRCVVLVTQVPVLRVGESLNLRDLVSRHYRRRGFLPKIPPDDREPIRRRTVKEMEALAARRPSVRVLRADAPFYLVDGTVRYSEGRSFFYADRDHLSDEGAQSLAETFVGVISAGCRPAPDLPASPSRPPPLRAP